MKSLTQFFSYMNDISFPYVVLRNFENLPHSVEFGAHSDLDLLVYDLEHWKEIFPEAKAEYAYPRVRFKMPIDSTYIYIDVRHTGDGYYPKEFEKDILKYREWNENGFYTPDPSRFRIALAYHVVHHKGINNYQRWLGDISVQELFDALKSSPVGYSVPDDQSVGKLNQYWKGATSIVEKQDGIVVKKQVNYNDYNLIDNEKRILSKARSIHFPKVYLSENDCIGIEDCGEILSVENLPKDWEKQLIDIVIDLKKNNIQHRDIRPSNLMIKDGIIKLIDFGWARFFDDKEDTPPDCLGFPYKPSYGFDDNFSMKKVIKHFAHQTLERTA